MLWIIHPFGWKVINMSEDIYHGTTTVGLVCKDGVVLGSDSRATMGHFIANVNAKKVYMISDYIGMTIAGSVADAQSLVNLLTAEAKLYEISRGKFISVKAAGSLLANVLRGNRYYPYQVQLLIGGSDYNGSHLYSIDAAGGFIEEIKMTSTGSGSPMALGLLENKYYDDILYAEGAVLAIEALRTAMKRDSASGNEMRIVVINNMGSYELTQEDIKNVITELDK